MIRTLRPYTVNERLTVSSYPTPALFRSSALFRTPFPVHRYPDLSLSPFPFPLLNPYRNYLTQPVDADKHQHAGDRQHDQADGCRKEQTDVGGIDNAEQ